MSSVSSGFSLEGLIGAIFVGLFVDKVEALSSLDIGN